MADITKPMALDESIHTTELTPRNIADVLASGLANIANNVKPDGSDISISVPGMTATNANDGFSELKGTLDSLQTTRCVGLTPFTSDITVTNSEVDLYTGTVNVPKGTYIFLYYIQASWTTASYQFNSKIQLGSTEASSVINYATPVTNQVLPFTGTITIPSDGNHTLKIKGYTSNANKSVTAKAFFTSSLTLTRVS